jgi:hypothetical protein
MSQRFLIPTLVLALAGLAGWALAQPGGGAGPRKGDGAGQFAVSAAGNSAVLLDRSTGKTWVLNQAVDGSSVWVPAKRLDTEEQVQQWMKAERERSEQRDALQRELLNKLNKLETPGKKKKSPD